MNTTTLLARSRLVLPVALLVLLAACGGGEQSGQDAGQDAGTADAPAADADQSPATGGDAGDGAPTVAEPAGTTTIAGVSFTPPSAWQDLGSSGMRQAQYEHPPVGEDTEPAEVNVFYFGPQSGGGVQANLDRWIGQMTLPGGGDPGAAAERSELTVDGMTAHVVELDGTYQAGGMGGGDAGPRPGYRLVGVVLEGPQGSLFFKLTGPEQTARVMEEGLLAMVRGAHKAG